MIFSANETSLPRNLSVTAVENYNISFSSLVLLANGFRVDSRNRRNK